MPTLTPKPGDVVTLANARWAVVEAEDRRLQLLRLNEAEPKPEPERHWKTNNVMDVQQVADELGRSEKTVRIYLQTGQLKGRKAGANWRILRSENPMLAVE